MASSHDASTDGGKRAVSGPSMPAKRLRSTAASDNNGKKMKPPLAAPRLPKPEDEEESNGDGSDKGYDSEAEELLCSVCGSGDNAKVLLMCEDCNRGYHCHCLAPRLKGVPKGDWFCAECINKDMTVGRGGWRWQGKEMYRDGHDAYYRGARRQGGDELLCEIRMGDCVECHSEAPGEAGFVAKVNSLWEDKARVMWVEVAWYSRPQEIQRGEHARRNQHEHEVFATTECTELTINQIQCKARVLTPDEFKRESAELTAAGTPVYMCKSLYNENTKEIRPLKQHQPGAAMAHAEAGGGVEGGERDSSLAVAANIPEGSSELSVKLMEASNRLKLSYVPKTLPCRETERDDIYGFVEGAITRGGQGSPIYIYGVPGTGKTATVHEVMRRLEQSHSDGRIPAFQTVEINALKLSDPHQAYCFLWESLGGKRVSPAQAALMLEKRFTSKRQVNRKTCVLIIDELDFLLTRKQKVIYDMFDWPSNPNARLVVIAIANTMDLPERMLPLRAYSRLELRRVAFAPYTYAQIGKIVHARLHDLISLFVEGAIELTARKVSAITGDVRRALEILRRAVELAGEASSVGQEGQGATAVAPVQMAMISRAVSDLHTSNVVVALRNLPLQEKLALITLYRHQHSTGLVETPFEQLYERHVTMCTTQDGFFVPTRSELWGVCINLSSFRLTLTEPDTPLRWQRIRLNVDPDDIPFALDDDEQVGKLVQVQ